MIHSLSNVINITFTIGLIFTAIDDIIAVYLFGLPSRPAHYFLIRLVTMAFIMFISQLLAKCSADELKRRKTNL